MSANWSSNVEMWNPIRHSRRCGWCGVPTASKRKVCNQCQGIEFRKDIEPQPKHALVGGEWVNVRGIQRWVA